MHGGLSTNNPGVYQLPPAREVLINKQVISTKMPFKSVSWHAFPSLRTVASQR